MKHTAVLLLILFVVVPGIPAVPPAPPQPELNCRAAVLLDYETGRVLFQKNPDMAIPPASMTKLVTAYTFLLETVGGRVDLDEVIAVDKAGDYRSAPPQSSLMFLEEGQRVTGRDLLAGLAVPSGNDAAVAVAVYAAGSVEAFVELMNQQMEDLGLVSTRFVEPSGYSEYNITTAGEFARFCREYIQAFPDISLENSSLLNYTYPKPVNLGNGGTSTLGPITQSNHNELIGRYSWADGLKTGYIEESGYNVALTAEKDGRRLVCVIMGIDKKNGQDAGLRRVVDGVNLLSYGFYAFTNLQILPPDTEPFRVYGGKKKTLAVTAEPSPTFTFSYPETASLRREYIPGPPLMAPVNQGSEVGIWKLYLEEEELGSYPVTAAETVERGGFFRRFFGKILFRLTGNQ
ncbi:MAG: D-alanyl-D-alanine carboxypeptidase [Spirochaetales bacterium]|nr:D-alanyl-D-alanine carboxypeptidase [Spirochaetales bacterium]